MQLSPPSTPPAGRTETCSTPPDGRTGETVKVEVEHAARTHIRRTGRRSAVDEGEGCSCGRAAGGGRRWGDSLSSAWKAGPWSSYLGIILQSVEPCCLGKRLWRVQKERKKQLFDHGHVRRLTDKLPGMLSSGLLLIHHVLCLHEEVRQASPQNYTCGEPEALGLLHLFKRAASSWTRRCSSAEGGSAMGCI